MPPPAPDEPRAEGTPTDGFRKRAVHAVELAALGILLNLVLIATPGYYSHDELEWGVRGSAVAFSEIAWSNAMSFDTLLYRPLSNDIWLIASHLFFDVPAAMHAFAVALHLASGAALYAIVKELGGGTRTATASFLVFAGFPTATVTVGWAATVADLTALLFAFCAVLVAMKRRTFVGGGLARRAASYGLFAVLCACALLSKEHAVVLPGVLLLLGSMLPGRWAPDLIAISAALAGTLVLTRSSFMAGAPVDSYAMSAVHAPGNLLAYFLFPFTLDNLEVQDLYLLTPAPLCVLAFALHSALLVLLYREAGPRAVTAYAALFCLALLAMLPLPRRFSHYTYAATPVFAVAFGWLFASRRPRVVLAAAALAAVPAVHSLWVQKSYFDTGIAQTRFFTSLYSALQGLGEGAGVKTGRPIAVVMTPDSPMVRRAVHDLVRLRDIPLRHQQISAVADVADVPANAVVLQALPSGNVVLPATCGWGGARACAPR